MEINSEAKSFEQAIHAKNKNVHWFRSNKCNISAFLFMFLSLKFTQAFTKINISAMLLGKDNNIVCIYLNLPPKEGSDTRSVFKGFKFKAFLLDWFPNLG